jgi:hypothetical protein
MLNANQKYTEETRGPKSLNYFLFIYFLCIPKFRKSLSETGCTKLRNEIETQRTKRNETKRNITQRKYTKMRNETQRNILKYNKNNMNGTRSDEKV